MRKKRKIIGYALIYLLIALAVIFVFLRFDRETPQNTSIMQGSVSDVRLASYHKSGSYATFRIGETHCIYRWIGDTSLAKKKAEKLQTLSLNHAEVTVVCSKDIRLKPLFWGRTEVVEVRKGTEVIYSVDEHNHNEDRYKVESLILIGLSFAVYTAYIVVIEVVLSEKKRKKKNKK